jgi:hypothetical protein
MLGERFDQARGEVDVLPDADPDALARIVFMISEGIAAQAASDATTDDLPSVVVAWHKPTPGL